MGHLVHTYSAGLATSWKTETIEDLSQPTKVRQNCATSCQLIELLRIFVICDDGLC